MSEAPPVRVQEHRFWIPVLLVALGAAAVAGLQFFPDESLDDGRRNTYSMAAGILVVGLIALWHLFFSGFSWTARLVGLAGAFVLVYFAAPTPAGGFIVSSIEFNGFMAPNLRFAWEDNEAALARHRLLAGAADGAADLTQVSPDDMPEYRGARRDGVSQGPALETVWSADEPKRLWIQPVGGGYAAFSVVGTWLVTIEQRRASEAVVCYDGRTGAECWIHEYPAFFRETLGGDGPRATPTIHEGKVYSLGATGELVRLDGRTGRADWRVNILSLNGAANLTWGMSGSPLVLDGLVIVTPGSQKAGKAEGAILALKEKDGSVAWKSGSGLGGYASPMLAKLCGERQILAFEGEGLSSYAASDGARLWHSPWKSEFDINAAQPIVVDDRTVFISSNAGSALLEISQENGEWSARPKWTSRDMKCHYSNPILYEGHVYGLDNGILACVRLTDGKRTWKGGRYGHAQMLLRGSVFVILSEKGEIAMVEANPEEYHELGKIQALDDFKTWNNPALVGNRLYVRNHVKMAAYALPLEKRGP